MLLIFQIMEHGMISERDLKRMDGHMSMLDLI